MQRSCFCLSKARDGSSGEARRLRAELAGMKVSARRQRAAAAGASEEDVDAAIDADEPLAAFVALLLQHEKPAEEPSAALRHELEELKLSQVRRRAAAAGISPEQLDEADDEESPKAAIIQLLLALAPPEGGGDEQGAE